ncbi:MAG: hypothetical protein E7524_04465 [Ruminococcaceae bacterium]|nr:hypothetical protein [Oscillospiraceae bacterium]
MRLFLKGNNMYQVYNDNKRLLGEFIPNCAGFNIKSLNLPAAWEYIYQNRDILMKVDQYGPVYAQNNPPADIMLFKRESGQRFSNWLVWIKKNEEAPFNNYFRPQINGADSGIEPENLSISFLPEKAVYEFTYNGLKLKTELAIPLHGKEIAMKLSVTNTEKNTAHLQLKPFLVPYCNEAMLAPWDKNEWYLRSGFGNEADKGVFWTELLNPSGDKSKRRTMVMFTDGEGLKNTELSLEKFVGNGSVYCPEFAVSGELRIPADRTNGYGEYMDDAQIYACPPVYAMEYEWNLDAGETKTLTQVLSMPSNREDGSMASKEDAFKSLQWFSEEQFGAKVAEVKAFYDDICSVNTVKTPDEMFNYYMNYWVPIQMNWVASLDRGWPSGMRGTRDSANDYSALIYTDLKSCREVLLTLLSCQRTDGWFLRQYSAAGRKGKHDERPYVDGGVAVLEFFYKYVTYSGDTSVIEEKLPWLDSDTESTVWEHMIAAMDYYLAPENIGEHGLCKIRGGDWLDSVNGAGLEGRGESVMVTCQTINALGYMAELCEAFGKNTEKIAAYNAFIPQFKESLRESAVNKKGYYNSVFNDDGKWLFSDCDPDGEERPYGPSNWYAVISGTAKKEELDKVFAVKDMLKSEFGYRLFYPPLGAKPIAKVGRTASGDVPAFMGENGNNYNHGSQGFLARALGRAGKGDDLFEVIKWMLPCYQDKHPTSAVMTAPYAIINCWQELPSFRHRGMLTFLTGTVAMCVRAAYEWLCGVDYTSGGVTVEPSMPEAWNEMSFSIKYQGKTLDISYKRKGESSLTVNGEEISISAPTQNRYNGYYFISSDKLCKEKNLIEVSL